MLINGLKSDCTDTHAGICNLSVVVRWIYLQLLAQPTTSVGQPKCNVYFSIEAAPHALTDWFYTRQVRWRYGVVQSWADGLKRAKLTPPTVDEVTAAHDKLQQEITSYRLPDRPADFPDLKSYNPVQYWPLDARETAQLENWLRNDGLKKFPESVRACRPCRLCFSNRNGKGRF